ncbi:MAG TPA: peptidoglycan DD-metalloendopeptidase family protein [Actinomycetota bacterium]
MRSSRAPARAIALLTVGVLLLGGVPGPAAAVDNELREARLELRATKAKIRAKSKRMNALQRELNKLATQISRNHDQVLHAEKNMDKLQGKLDALEVNLAQLQQNLDDRNREAFIEGPGAPVLYLLTATSAAEAAARISIITEMNRRDDLLAHRVQNNAERLSRGRAQMLRLQRARQLAIQQLQVQQAQLDRKLELSRKLFAQLKDHKDDAIDAVLEVLLKVRPFAVCPVQGPHAIANDFGIWVHRSPERGGDHVHQGNDIMAPGGTPIVAPFPGTAVAVPNNLGGNAVKVYGRYGYVYNAHLSAYGTLGPVEIGDVIGYVGATGNTSANHDHFEWHPNNGPAADPYPFLLKVC